MVSYQDRGSPARTNIPPVGPSALSQSGTPGAGAKNSLEVHAPRPWLQRMSEVAQPSPRCNEKGCVFPSASSASKKCFYHDRQGREPAFFHSRQPTTLLLDRAKFGLADPDDDARHDRRRLAQQREATLEDAA